MDELAEQLLFVLGHFGMKSVIGFGVGAGANILARFALAHPEKVNALCLINCVSTQAGWIDRMGLSEAERSSPEIARHDSGCAGLPDVASLWQGKDIYAYVYTLRVCKFNVKTVRVTCDFRVSGGQRVK